MTTPWHTRDSGRILVGPMALREALALVRGIKPGIPLIDELAARDLVRGAPDLAVHIVITPTDGGHCDVWINAVELKAGR